MWSSGHGDDLDAAGRFVVEMDFFLRLEELQLSRRIDVLEEEL